MRTNLSRDFVETYVIRKLGSRYWQKLYLRQRAQFLLGYLW